MRNFAVIAALIELRPVCVYRCVGSINCFSLLIAEKRRILERFQLDYIEIPTNHTLSLNLAIKNALIAALKYRSRYRSTAQHSTEHW